MDETIGYRKPPIRHQYRKGQSGNLHGRPKRKPQEFSDIIGDVINGSMTFSVGQHKRRASRDEVFLKSLVNRALTGSAAAADEIFRFLSEERSLGLDKTSIEVSGWLPDFPGQTAEQKALGQKTL